MSHIAVWTDGKERVCRKHCHPDDVATDGAYVTEEDPSPPKTEDYEEVQEFFNETDGFYYTVSGTDPYAGLTEKDKAILRMAKQMNYDNFESLEDEITRGSV